MHVYMTNPFFCLPLPNIDLNSFQHSLTLRDKIHFTEISRWKGSDEEREANGGIEEINA